MGFLKLAAGVAVGYVLGSRAGREKYENIAATARKVGSHPTVVQAQDKAKALIGTQTDKVNAKLSAAAASADPNKSSSEPAVTGSSTPAYAKPSTTSATPSTSTTSSTSTISSTTSSPEVIPASSTSSSPATGASTATTTGATAARKRPAAKPGEFGVATEPPR